MAPTTMTRAEAIELSPGNQMMKTLLHIRSGIEHLKDAHNWISSSEFKETRDGALAVAETQGDREKIATTWKLMEIHGEQISPLAAIDTSVLDNVLSEWRKMRDDVLKSSDR